MEPEKLFDEPAPSAILPAEHIHRLVNTNQLIKKDGFASSCVESTSYDIRVGSKAVIGGEGKEIDLTSESLTIPPGGYAGVISLEAFALPNDVLARIGSKRKFSYDALILLTGSVVDPGYEGHLLFGLYNASPNKVVVPMKRKICTVIFEQLGEEQDPVGSDPDLVAGQFSGDFLNKMANMEVLPWSQISQEVQRIRELAQDVLELKANYTDVLEPIKRLTENVDNVTNDVRLLAQQLGGVSKDAGQLEKVAGENARQITEISTNLRVLTSRSGEHEREIGDVSRKFSRFSAAFNIFGAIILLALGALITWIVGKAVGE